MTTAMVILNNVPQMSLCSICHKPGACCSRFNLFVDQEENPMTVWENTWREDAQNILDERRLPFRPVELLGRFTDDESGDVYGTPYFSCDHLTTEGQCGIYNERPRLCRTFVPASSPLCVFHKESDR